MLGAMPAVVLVAADATALSALAQMAARGALPYPVYACAGGAEALSYIDRSGAVCVIVDDRVSDIGGLALAQAISGRWPTLPVALLASGATTDLYDAAQAAGCVAVLSKPVGPATLQAVVGAMLLNQPKGALRSRTVGHGWC